MYACIKTHTHTCWYMQKRERELVIMQDHVYNKNTTNTRRGSAFWLSLSILCSKLSVIWQAARHGTAPGKRFTREIKARSFMSWKEARDALIYWSHKQRLLCFLVFFVLFHRDINSSAQCAAVIWWPAILNLPRGYKCAHPHTQSNKNLILLSQLLSLSSRSTWLKCLAARWPSPPAKLASQDTHIIEAQALGQG